jgi:hypothetical protein
VRRIATSLLAFLLCATALPAATFNVWSDQGTVIPAVSGDAPEQPNVLYESSGCVIVSNPCFKMWFTTGPANTPVGINYAESSNGTTWTRYTGNPVISARWGSRVFKNGSTYYLYCSTEVFATAIQTYTSTDGLSWTQQTASALSTSASGWDSNSIGQLDVAGQVGATWYGYYWGINTQANPAYNVGQATSTDLVHWSKSAGNPVAAFDSGTFANGASWIGSGALFFENVNGEYFAWSQTTQAAFPGSINNLPSDILRWSAPSAAGPWTPLGNITLPRTQTSEGVNSAIGQVADPTMVAATGNLYFYFTASTNGGSGDNYTINCAIASSMTLTQLVETYEGVQDIPLSGDPGLNLSNLATDNFSRANANPIGGNWTPVATGSFAGGTWTTGQIVSDAFESSAVSEDPDSFYNAITWPADQWAAAVAITSSANSYLGLDLRASASTSVYRFYWTSSSGLGHSGTWTFQAVKSGVSKPVTATGTMTINASDALIFCVAGDTLSLFQNGTLIGVGVDSASPISSGSAGLLVVPVTSTANAALDNWSGGSVVNPTLALGNQAGAFVVGP